MEYQYYRIISQYYLLVNIKRVTTRKEDMLTIVVNTVKK